jgi:hypothetical protein
LFPGLATKKKKGLLFCEQKRSKKNFGNLDPAGLAICGPKKEVLAFCFSLQMVTFDLTLRHELP